MASDIRGVILVPAAGDPLGLLREGPCGARPPTACRAVPGEGWLPWCGDRVTCARALVLAWDGEPVAEGLDRAQRTAYPLAVDERLVWLASFTWTRDMGWLRAVTEDLAALLGCTVILVDAEGREVVAGESATTGKGGPATTTTAEPRD